MNFGDVVIIFPNPDYNCVDRGITFKEAEKYIQIYKGFR